MSASLFAHVPAAPPIEVLDMKRKHDEDSSDVKINLTVGGYKVASDVLCSSVSWYGPNIITKTYSKIMTIDDRESFCLFSFILAKRADWIINNSFMFDID